LGVSLGESLSEPELRRRGLGVAGEKREGQGKLQQLKRGQETMSIVTWGNGGK